MSICQGYRVSGNTRKRKPKKMMSAAASIAILTWHDLKPNVSNEQFLTRAYGKPDSFFRVTHFAIFSGYIPAKLGYIHSKYVHPNATKLKALCKFFLIFSVTYFSAGSLVKLSELNFKAFISCSQAYLFSFLYFFHRRYVHVLTCQPYRKIYV